MRKIAAACLLLLIVPAAWADALDVYLRAEMANQRISGAAVAVLRDSKRNENCVFSRDNGKIARLRIRNAGGPETVADRVEAAAP